MPGVDPAGVFLDALRFVTRRMDDRRSVNQSWHALRLLYRGVLQGSAGCAGFFKVLPVLQGSPRFARFSKVLQGLFCKVLRQFDRKNLARTRRTLQNP